MKYYNLKIKKKKSEKKVADLCFPGPESISLSDFIAEIVKDMCGSHAEKYSYTIEEISLGKYFLRINKGR